MRVRPHVDAAARGEIGGPHVIEKDKRTDVLACRCRQDASDGKAAEVARPGVDHGCDRRGVGAARAGRINCG
jgi:hypothetical protein